jgi:hypothetical protein
MFGLRPRRIQLKLLRCLIEPRQLSRYNDYLRAGRQRSRVRVPVGSRMFTPLYRPDRYWGPPNLLSVEYMGLFPQGLSGRGVKLTAHVQLVARSRKRGYIHSLPHTSSWPSTCLINRDVWGIGGSASPFLTSVAILTRRRKRSRCPLYRRLRGPTSGEDTVD